MSITERSEAGESDSSFVEGLTSLINLHSMERDSDTPDFILARYIWMCLVAFDFAVNEREEWYGRKMEFKSAVQCEWKPCGWSRFSPFAPVEIDPEAPVD